MENTYNIKLGVAGEEKSISGIDNEYTVNKKKYKIEDLSIQGNFLSFRVGTRFFEYTLEEQENKKFSIYCKGSSFPVELKSDLDLFIEKIGFKTSDSKKNEKNIYSVMPGNILELLVEEGKMVKKWENVLIIEAMKMENIICSPGNFKIKKIHVSKNQSIQKNTLLIEGE